MNYRTRPIKFLAWDKINNCWYVPTFEAYKGNLHELLVSFSGDLVAHNMQGISHESTFPDQYELVQFTGLKDKKGVEMFEGFIVRYNIGGEWVIGVIEYDTDRGCFVKRSKTIDKDLVSYISSTTVIGNIYENPELLK